MHRYLIVVSAAALLAACGSNQAQNTSTTTTTTDNTAVTAPTDNTTTAPSGNVASDANPAASIASPAPAPAAADFVTQAASSDMFEIAAARLARGKSMSQDVKDFAAMMVMDHTKSTAALKKAIADSGQSLPLPTKLPDDLQAKLDGLRMADAASFDKMYMAGQVDAHEMALNLLTGEAKGGDTPQLKAFAGDIAPVVQKHLDKAKMLRDSLK